MYTRIVGRCYEFYYCLCQDKLKKRLSALSQLNQQNVLIAKINYLIKKYLSGPSKYFSCEKDILS